MKRIMCLAISFWLATFYVGEAQPVWQPVHTFTLEAANILHLQSVGDKVVVSTTMSALYRSKPDGSLDAVLLVLGNSISEVSFKSEMDWLVGGENAVYYSQDGGTHWEMEETPFDRFVSATAWVGDVMYVGTDDYPDMRNDGHGRGIWRSFDKGRTWQAINSGIGDDAYITKMATDADGNVWAAVVHAGYAPSDGLYRWNETGELWERVPIGMYDASGGLIYNATSTAVYGLTVMADGSIWVGFDGVCTNFQCSGVNVSRDGGQTWRSVNGGPDLQSPTQPVVNDVVLDPEYGLMGPLANYNRGFAYMSGDNGWTMRRELPHSSNPYETYRMAATADGHTWTARRLDKTLYRLARTGTGIDDEKPVDFELATYPNPFNPSTVLAFTLPGTSHVTVHVYDQVGRLVATLADRSFGTGSHSITWEARDAASGVYLFRITAGGRVQTAKATLVR